MIATTSRGSYDICRSKIYKGRNGKSRIKLSKTLHSESDKMSNFKKFLVSQGTYFNP